MDSPDAHIMGGASGVAKSQSNLKDTVAQTGFKGTPGFMSPEQLQVGSRVPTIRSAAR